MARDFFINGETMVSVNGNVNAPGGIANLTQLGLSDAPIRVTQEYRHKDINVDAWGEVPVDKQFMLAQARIQMTLIHIDVPVLDACIQEAMGVAAVPGQMARAGTRMGNNQVRFAATNHYIGLNLYSPIGNKPYRFYYAYLDGSVEFPLGTEKSIWTLNWVAIPYTQDPWNGGVGAQGAVLWDNILDT